MANKVIIGILVLLVILTGGIGYYSYTLNQQIDRLGEQLNAYEIEQSARVAAVSDELVSLREETLKSVHSLEGQIKESQVNIDTLGEELGTARDRITGVEGEISGFSSRVDTLNDRVSSTEADISRSVIDASKVYDKVSRVSVRITNGQSTVGSGFIYDNEGHVVTAHHVIDGLSPIYVMMHDGRTSMATIVGSCPFSDVAVLKMESNPSIEPLILADSGLVRIGEPVIAVGSPLDLPDTLTAGIISQKNRFSEIQYNSQSLAVPNLLQFDAPVNFGNSGCPLANSDGEILGVVIARIYPTEGDGIYYAVSSNKAKRVAEAIIANGSFDYPWIGVGISNLTSQIVQERSLETANGVLVDIVFSGSPAQASGIQAGDIIVAINDIPVRNMADLTSYLGEFTSPGDVPTIDVLRGTTRMTLSVEIGIREQ